MDQKSDFLSAVYTIPEKDLKHAVKYIEDSLDIDIKHRKHVSEEIRTSEAYKQGYYAAWEALTISIFKEMAEKTIEADDPVRTLAHITSIVCATHIAVHHLTNRSLNCEGINHIHNVLLKFRSMEITNLTNSIVDEILVSMKSKGGPKPN